MSQDERTYDEGSAMATEDEAPASSIPPDEQTATSNEPGTGAHGGTQSTIAETTSAKLICRLATR